METAATQQTPHLTIDKDKNKRYSVAFSPDGTLLAGDKDNTIRLWDITTAQEKKMFWVDIGECCTSTVRSVAFSPDGESYRWWC